MAEAGYQQRPGPDPRHQLGADPGHRHDHGHHRQVGHPGLERAVVPDVLHEDGQEEEHPEHRRAQAEHDQVGPGPAAVAEDPQRHQGMLAARLDEQERGQEHHRRGQRGEDLGVAPVRHPVGAGRRAGQAVDQGGQAERAGDRAGQVEPAGVALGLGQGARGQQGDQKPDRHVHEQHPAPGEVGGEHAADEQADGRAGDAHGGVDAHGPVAFPALREVGRDQRQSGRRDDRTAHALQGARGQQPGLGVGETAEQRGDREQDDPGDEDPLAAEDVAGPAAEQQQAAEGQRVGVDDPLQAGAGEAERGLDVRQRDVDDGGVQHHHELRGGDDQQGQAQMPVSGAGRPGGPALDDGTARGRCRAGRGCPVRHSGVLLSLVQACVSGYGRA